MGMTALWWWKDKAGRNHQEGGRKLTGHPESSGGFRQAQGLKLVVEWSKRERV